jgi:hypothetical protein
MPSDDCLEDDDEDRASDDADVIDAEDDRAVVGRLPTVVRRIPPLAGRCCCG